MSETHITTENLSLRLERDRLYPMKHPILGTTPQMEDTMFEAMMKFGGYRVDYMKSDRMGSPSAIGLYVLGDLPIDQSYSRTAKHALFSALCMIRDQAEADNLVAVYLDVNHSVNLSRPAYQQMKRDMKAGMFHRLCVPSVRDLVSDEDAYADFWHFYRELEWCELFSIESGNLRPVAFREFAGCPMVGAW